MVSALSETTVTYENIQTKAHTYKNMPIHTKQGEGGGGGEWNKGKEENRKRQENGYVSLGGEISTKGILHYDTYPTKTTIAAAAAAA